MKKSKTIPDSASSPTIFLIGPPGVGKSTFGLRACEELGLRFLDLSDATATQDAPPDLSVLSRAIAEGAADVIELPWHLQNERKTMMQARQSGVLMLLWAHPEDMQARSGHNEPLFTPVPRLKIRGGFGRNGTSCREFRSLERASSEETLLLVNLPFKEAAEVVQDWIAAIRQEAGASLAEQEGILDWVEDWRHSYDTDPQTGIIIVNAMARYLYYLRSIGKPQRTLSGIRSDLNIAGLLVARHNSNDISESDNVLEYFHTPPREAEFRREFTDSAALSKRYRRSLEGFARFLYESGDLVGLDEELL
ncbi:hypothetical protein KAI87_07755 [Myxococcota bacterium]|nr:hypothetical protein [Myxococcota bacterium]